MTDPREAAARYRARQQSDGAEEDAESGTAPGIAAATDRAAFIETAIQVAIRRGDFDDLPGAGKPLEGLGTHHDPDWWIRRKIEQENLTGLGPPAILLRTEDRELDDQLDLLGREVAPAELPQLDERDGALQGAARHPDGRADRDHQERQRHGLDHDDDAQCADLIE